MFTSEEACVFHCPNPDAHQRTQPGRRRMTIRQGFSDHRSFATSCVVQSAASRGISGSDTAARLTAAASPPSHDMRPLGWAWQWRCCFTCRFTGVTMVEWNLRTAHIRRRDSGVRGGCERERGCGTATPHTPASHGIARSTWPDGASAECCALNMSLFIPV